MMNNKNTIQEMMNKYEADNDMVLFVVDVSNLYASETDHNSRYS